MLGPLFISTKTIVLAYYTILVIWSRFDETAAASLPYGNRPARAERVRGRRSVAYFTARGVEADPRARGGARDRCVRAPRKASGLDHRAGQGGDYHRRAHPLRGEQPA